MISSIALAVSGCFAANACIFAGSGFPVAGSGLDASSCSQNASGVFTGKTGIGIIAVRHSSPPGKRKRRPKLFTDIAESAAYGWPPAMENRAITGTDAPAAKTEAFDSGTPAPLLANVAEAHSPLAG